MNAIIYPCNDEGAENKKEDVWAWLCYGFIKYVLSMLTWAREKLWNDLLSRHIHLSFESFYWLHNIIRKIWMKKTKLTITMLCVAWLKPQLGLKIGKNLDNYECIFERSFPFGHPTSIKNINYEWMIDKLAIINVFMIWNTKFHNKSHVPIKYTYLQIIVSRILCKIFHYLFSNLKMKYQEHFL